MARTKASVSSPDTVSITYDLPSLPSAQHRAGLAGLLLLIESMKRREMGPLPEITAASPTGFTITLAEESLQALFNDLYDAQIERETTTKKRQGKRKPVAIESVTNIDATTGRERKEKRFVYEFERPKASFLAALGLEGKDVWLKLWRDAVLGTIRMRYTTQEAYRETARGKEAKGAGVSKIWPELPRWEAERKRGKQRTTNVPSSLFIGAQDHNAERVRFCDDTSRALLLHFWPVVMVPYVPRVIDKDGKEDFGDGYSIAVPDVRDIAAFAELFVELLASRTDDAVGYRPAEAVIAIPEEGALEMASRLAGAAQSRSARQYHDSVSAIEVVTLRKKGNNLATLSHHRVEAGPEMLADFEHIRREYRHPIVRAHLIGNLVNGEPWYSGFGRLAARLPAEHVVWKVGNPRSAGQFGRDIGSKFRSVKADLEKER